MNCGVILGSRVATPKACGLMVPTNVFVMATGSITGRRLAFACAIGSPANVRTVVTMNGIISMCAMGNILIGGSTTTSSLGSLGGNLCIVNNGAVLIGWSLGEVYGVGGKRRVMIISFPFGFVESHVWTENLSVACL